MPQKLGNFELRDVGIYRRLSLIVFLLGGLTACGGEDTVVYTINATNSEGGNISPSSVQVEQGKTTLFNVQASSGFQVASVDGCNGILTENTYTTGVISSPCDVKATFRKKRYVLNSTAGEGGDITPTTGEYEHGTQANFSVTSMTGYAIDSVTGCNGNLTGNIYITAPITSACAVTAKFKKKSYVVTTTTTVGGSIDPNTTIVTHGNTTTFTVNPQEGYSLANVVGCGGRLVGNTFTSGAIVADCKVEASFKINLYTVVANSNLGGQITPATQSVEHGKSAKLTVIAEPDHRVVTVSGCGGSFSGDTYTTAPIVSPCTIDTKFAFVAIGGLNDSGIDRCADNKDTGLNCPIAGYQGQDAEVGRDFQNSEKRLIKIGNGAKGFDYTKIGSDGKKLAIQDVEWNSNGSEVSGSRWSCVRDNVTGLIWELKTDDLGLHNKSNTYSWYNNNANRNGGLVGRQNGGVCVDSGCDTDAFVKAVNVKGLCGAQDWRLPTRKELLTIVHNGRHSPSVDISYFPLVPATWFWSSSPDSRFTNSAWGVLFSDGDSIIFEKNTDRNVILVRDSR